MFLENDYVIPLFDIQVGGPARAFECKRCGHISKTETGMLQHLRRSHEHQVQPCLFSMEDSKNPANGQPRKLQVFTKENIARTRMNSFPKYRSSIPDTELEAEASPELPQQNEPKTEEARSRENTSAGNSNSPTVPENSNSAIATSTNSHTITTGTK